MKSKIYCFVVVASLFTSVFLSCKKEMKPTSLSNIESSELKGENGISGHLKQTKTFSSEVVKEWLEVQSSLLHIAVPPSPFGVNAGRYMAYSGVTLYEAVQPGMPAYQSLSGQLNQMPEMPETEPGKAYHWPTCANAALAEITRRLFTFSANTNNVANNLENSLNAVYQAEINNNEIFERSKAFGKSIATAIADWAATDNQQWVNEPTIVFTDKSPGKWWPEDNYNTSVTFPNGLTRWGETRTIVAGSIDNVVSTPYPFNQTDPNSAYYRDFQEVYDISKNLTFDQKRLALYFDDPASNGYPSGASYFPVLKQIIAQLNPNLDIAAFAFAKTGMSLMDATIGSMKAKYEIMQERPFQFIRRVIEQNDDPATRWKPLINTPPYSDFPANHATFAGAYAHALTSVFGDNVHFSINTYEGKQVMINGNPVDLGSYSFNSFYDFANAIAISRVYGGIHTRHAVEEGVKQGIKTAQNIDKKVNFLK
jgi:hypothetical protein